MNDDYSVNDLYVPISEAPGILNLSRLELTECIRLGFIVPTKQQDILGPVFHMSELLAFVTRLRLAKVGLAVTFADGLLTALEVEGDFLCGRDDDYMASIHSALKQGPEQLLVAINYFGISIVECEFLSLYHGLVGDISGLIGKVQEDEMIEALISSDFDIQRDIFFNALAQSQSPDTIPLVA